MFPGRGGPKYLAVQPPVCSHSYLHLVACEPDATNKCFWVKPSPDLMIKFYLQQEDKTQQRGGSEDVMPPPCRKNTKWSPRSRALLGNQMVPPLRASLYVSMYCKIVCTKTEVFFWENTSLETALTVHLQNKNTACWKFEHFFRRNGKEGDFFCILFLY